MKSLTNIIYERLKLTKNSKLYEYIPKDEDELRKNIVAEVYKQGKGTHQRPVDLNMIDISEIVNSPTKSNFYDLFCTLPVTINYLDISNWNVGIYTGLTSMFKGCKELIEVDCTNWKFHDIINLAELFAGCTNLKQVIGIENWRVGHVENFNGMFRNCPSLEKLDLSKWDMRNARYMIRMFKDCTNLKTLGSIENWKFTDVINCNEMFRNCTSLDPGDLDKWKLGRPSAFLTFDNMKSDVKIPSWTNK